MAFAVSRESLLLARRFGVVFAGTDATQVGSLLVQSDAELDPFSLYRENVKFVTVVVCMR